MTHGEQAADLIRIVLESSLASLGVDTRGKSKEEIEILLDNARIMIRDYDKGSASGFYIFRARTELRAADVVTEIDPVYFISDAFVNKDRKVAVILMDFRSNHSREITYSPEASERKKKQRLRLNELNS